MTLTALTDDVFGDLTAVTITSCTLPQAIPPGGTYSCVFAADIVDTAANSPHQNTVTADATDDESSAITGSDTADVLINDVLPAITVTKAVNPLQVPTTGAPVVFTVEVTNDGVEPLSLTALDDDIYGDIGDALNPLVDATTCSLPQSIGVSGTYSCTFDATPSGPAGATETDTVTATVSDDEGNSLDGSDSATVTFGDAAISGVVWLDSSVANNVADAGEPPVSGLTVELLDDLGTVIASRVSDGSGGYAFDGLVAGDYQVRVTPPAGGVFVAQDAGTDDTVDSDVDAAGLTAPISLLSGQTLDTIDAGIQAASLTDTVWLDLNGDGVRDPGEDGIPGITVELLDDLGAVVATTTTDAAGDFTFAGLEPADYSVRVDYPGAVFSPAGTDSLVDAAGQSPAPFALLSGPNTDLGDAGVIPAVIGDYVWLDVDVDGAQDAGEPGVAATVVNLYDGVGTLVAATATDTAGAYSFTVAPGDYRVEVVAPAGAALTAQDVGGDDAVDSDVDPSGSTAVFAAASGPNTDAADAGLEPASIVDTVWLDLNDDGIQDAGEPGIAGIPVNLYDTGGVLVATATTDATGEFVFAGLLPGDYDVEVAPVFPGAGFAVAGAGTDPALDSDVDPATGRATVSAASGVTTGVSDAGVVPGSITDVVWLDADRDGIQDVGEPGVSAVVVNLYDGVGTLIATTTTDASGGYSFSGLIPGDYEIEVVPPAGAVLVPPDAGTDDAVDSDVDETTGRVSLAVESGSNTTESAAGLLPGKIAGTVWFDNDADTAQGPGEPGISGISVGLYDDLGALVASVLTPADGAYLFDGLAPGDYTVRIDPASIPPLTTQTYDRDGLLDDETVVAVAFSEDVTDVDFGYQAPAEITGILFEDADGNGVFDAGELPLSGVDVIVSDSFGNVFVVTSAADGSYSSPVEPGTVLIDVVESTLPAGVVLTTSNEPQSLVAVPATNSSAEPIGYQPPVPVSGTVWDDRNGNGAADAGEPELDGVTIGGLCAGPDGTLGTGDDVTLGSQTTSAGFLFPAVPVGECEFVVDPGSLPPGVDIATFDLDGGDDGAAVVSVPPGGLTGVDFGYRGIIDLFLSKVSTEGNVQAGDDAEWLLTVTNIGLTDATSVITVTDDLPTGLSYLGATGTGWTCAETDGLVTCEHPGPLAVGASLELRILTSVAADLSGTVNNFAEVSVSGDGVLTNNFAFAGVGLLPNTGFNLREALIWSVLSLLLGAGLILVTRRRDEDQDLVRNS